MRTPATLRFAVLLTPIFIGALTCYVAALPNAESEMVSGQIQTLPGHAIAQRVEQSEGARPTPASRAEPVLLTSVADVSIPAEVFFDQEDYFLDAPKAVAISGDTLVVSTLGDGAGVFQKREGQWTFQQSFNPSSSAYREVGGVAIDTDTIAIGTIVGRDAVFQVEVYRRTNEQWSLEDVLPIQENASHIYDSPYFAVAIDGDTVAARFERTVKIFFRENDKWIRQADITIPGADTGAATVFHTAGLQSIALHQNTLIVGDNRFWYADGLHEDSAAYVYTRTDGEWAYSTTLQPSSPSTGFGYTIAMDGTTAAIGSPFGNIESSDVGSVYIFENNGSEWTETASVNIGKKPKNNAFGISVTLQGDLLVSQSMRGPYAFTRNNGEWSLRGQFRGAYEAYYTAPMVALDNGVVADVQFVRPEDHLPETDPRFNRVARLLIWEGILTGFSVEDIFVGLSQNSSKDKITLRCRSPLADGTPLDGMPFSITVGTIVESGLFDKSGKGGTKNKRVMIQKPKRGVSRLQLQWTGDFADQLQAAGFVSTHFPRSLPINVSVTLGNSTYQVLHSTYFIYGRTLGGFTLRPQDFRRY